LIILDKSSDFVDEKIESLFSFEFLVLEFIVGAIGSLKILRSLMALMQCIGGGRRWGGVFGGGGNFAFVNL
jgi:hypothetical protein